jgi:TRAP-type mannitol/chloroaromatic compound transport system substrate-binding protein
MKRRAFLTGAAGVGALAAASSFPKPAISQGIRELKMHTCWPKRLPVLGTGAERLAERIGRMSGGKLTVKVYAAGELVPAFEGLDAVTSGTADMSHGAAYYWQGKHKAFNFFTAVPYGLNGPEHASWVYWGGGQQLWDELGQQFGFKPFLRGSTGVQMAGWFRKEIASLDDLKRLKMRIPGLGGDVLKALGVTVVSLPGGEIFPALQSGAIDATEWVGPFADITMGFYKITKAYHWPGFHEPGTSGELIVNLKVWESLPNDQKEMLRTLVDSEASLEFAEFTHGNGEALQTMVDKYKVNLKKLPDDVLTEIGKLSGEVVAQVASEDPFTKKVYESFLDFRKKQVAYTRISEQAYLNARSLPFKYST